VGAKKSGTPPMTDEDSKQKLVEWQDHLHDKGTMLGTTHV